MDYKNQNSTTLVIFLVLFTFIIIPGFLLLAGASGTMAAESKVGSADHVVGQIAGAYTQASTYSFLEEEKSLLVLAIKNS